MQTQLVSLKYLPQFEAFGISDEQINLFEKQKVILLISLSNQDMERLEAPQKAVAAV